MRLWSHWCPTFPWIDLSWTNWPPPLWTRASRSRCVFVVLINEQETHRAVQEYVSARLDSGSDDVWTDLVAEVEVSYSSHSAVVELLSKVGFNFAILR